MSALSVTPPMAAVLVHAGLLEDVLTPREAYWDGSPTRGRHLDPRCSHLGEHTHVQHLHTWDEALPAVGTPRPAPRHGGWVPPAYVGWAQCCTQLQLDVALEPQDAAQHDRLVLHGPRLLAALRHPTVAAIGDAMRPHAWPCDNRSPQRPHPGHEAGRMTSWYFATFDELAALVRATALDPNTILGADLAHTEGTRRLGRRLPGHPPENSERWSRMRRETAAFLDTPLTADDAWLQVAVADHGLSVRAINDGAAVQVQRSSDSGLLFQMHGKTLTRLLYSARNRPDRPPSKLRGHVHWTPVPACDARVEHFHHAAQLATQLERTGDIHDVVETLREVLTTR